MAGPAGGRERGRGEGVEQKSGGGRQREQGVGGRMRGKVRGVVEDVRCLQNVQMLKEGASREDRSCMSCDIMPRL